MSGLEPEVLAVLGLVALLAGLIDAIAGGGGLLTVPALMVAGFDPVQAIATNKLQGTFGTASATFAFARARLIEWRAIWPLALIAAAASVAGAFGVQLLSRPLLEAAIPVLLVAVALYFALSRKVQDQDAKARLPWGVFALLVPPIVGVYDGIFGPGAGSFYMLAFVTLLGFGVVRATAHTKLLNFASNAGSLSLYIVLGAVVWPVGLVMAGAALIGAQIGSRLALKLGSRLIRPLLVAVCCALAVRLLVDPGNPWRRALAGLF
jgi:uncharacterized membrane protein YfcA